VVARYIVFSIDVNNVEIKIEDVENAENVENLKNV